MPLLQHSGRIYGVELNGVVIGIRTRDDRENLWFDLKPVGRLNGSVPVLLTIRKDPHRLYLHSAGPAVTIGLLLNGMPLSGISTVIQLNPGDTSIIPLRFEEAGVYTLSIIIKHEDESATSGETSMFIVLIRVVAVRNGESVELMKPAQR